MSSTNLRGTRREVCKTCRGNGKVLKDSALNLRSLSSWGWKTCPDCKGKGYIEYRLPPQQTRRF